MDQYLKFLTMVPAVDVEQDGPSSTSLSQMAPVPVLGPSDLGLTPRQLSRAGKAVKALATLIRSQRFESLPGVALDFLKNQLEDPLVRLRLCHCYVTQCSTDAVSNSMCLLREALKLPKETSTSSQLWVGFFSPHRFPLRREAQTHDASAWRKFATYVLV